MIAVELTKQTRRLRTYVGLSLVAIIPIIFTVSFKINPPHGERVENAIFALATQSGISMTLAVLLAVSQFLLVVVASLFAGETVSGEASWGTLRYLLLRPVRRSRLLGSKLVVAVILGVIATLVASIVGLIAGTAAFGWHSLVIATPAPKGAGSAAVVHGALSGITSTIPQGVALARLALTNLYVAWSMAAFVTFAFMLSTMTDTPFGAVAGGVALSVVSQILNNIPALDRISYVFPTHYLDAWQGLFVEPTQTADMIRGVMLQVPYALVFCLIAWWWFARKDIVS